MHLRNTLPTLLTAAVALSAFAATGCSKKETPPPPTASTPATPTPAAEVAPAPTTPAAPTPAPAAAAPKQDPLRSMVDSASKAADSTAAQLKESASTAMAQTTPSPAPAPAAGSTVANPASPDVATALQSEAGAAQEGAMATLSASTAALQKQADELLTRYSGELATLKSGFTAVKGYVDQHPELLPEAAKGKYQQLNAMMPQLQSLVGTLKDYKNVDLATIVPKLQTDFAQAKSLYSEVRALLPEDI